MPEPRFAGAVALVTGAGAGIGRATALALAREGAAAVVAADVDGEAARATAAAIAAAGASAEAAACDVTRESQVAELVSGIAARHGRLDVAVNNAGVAGPVAGTAELDAALWERVLRVDLTGVFLCMKHEIAQMRAQGGGAIVNIASTIGVRMTVPGTAAYAAAKAGVGALTRTAASEYVRDGVRVNAVCPGPVDTAMSLRPGETAAARDARLREALPIGRVATVDEIVAAVLWLAAPESGYAVGHELVVDGGGSI